MNLDRRYRDRTEDVVIVLWFNVEKESSSSERSSMKRANDNRI